MIINLAYYVLIIFDDFIVKASWSVSEDKFK